MKVIHIVLSQAENDYRVFKETGSLSNFGYKIKVLMLQNNQNSFPSRQLRDGFEVERIKLLSKRLPKWKPVQILKYVEFVYHCLKVIKEYNPKIIHCHDLNALPIGVLAKKNRKLIYDSHELHSNRFTAARNLWNRFIEYIFIQYIDTLISVSNSICEEIKNTYKLKKKSYTILNVPKREDFIKDETTINLINLRKKLNIPESNRIILYLGTIESKKGCLWIPQILRGIEKCHCLFLGNIGKRDIREKIIDESKRYGVLKRIHFIPPVPRNEIYAYSSYCDAGIMIYADRTLSYKYSLPNRLFQYIHCELPVITSNFFTEQVKFVNKYKIGIVVDSDYVTNHIEINKKTLLKITNKLRGLLNSERKLLEVKNNCLKAKKYCSWEKEEKKLLDIYSYLIKDQETC